MVGLVACPPLVATCRDSSISITEKTKSVRKTEFCQHHRWLVGLGTIVHPVILFFLCYLP